MTIQPETFTSQDGHQLYSWFTSIESPKAGILLVHGIGEHSGRYQEFAKKLAENGIMVMGFDLVGYGRSSGERGYVDSFDVHATDVSQALNRLRAKLPAKKPIFVLGHSMGGAVTMYTYVTQALAVDGIVLSGAALKMMPTVPAYLIRLAPILSRLIPKHRMKAVELGDVSRDPEVLALVDTDPLMDKGPHPIRTGAEILRAQNVVAESVNQIIAPLLIMHGTGDTIIPHSASVELYSSASSADKTLRLYEGLYHEILNEPEKETVWQEIVDWLDGQIKQASVKKGHVKSRKKGRHDLEG